MEAGPYRAMLTALGAGLREFCYRDEPLLHGYQPDELPPAAAGQLLAPWPNRIDNGRYTFNGAEEQLAVSEPAKSTAIHGLTRWANWTGIRHDASAVLLRCEPHGQQGYPFSVEIDALYEVDAETGLRVTITARNRGSHPAPYGNGWHPYFQVATPSIDECELTLPASRYLPLDERGLPSGPAEAVDGTQYDFRHMYDRLGYGFQPSELIAAYGLVQLDKLEDYNGRRRYAFDQYDKVMAESGSEKSIRPQPTEGVDTTWMHYPFQLAEGIDRNIVQKFFLERGIPTRMVFSGNILRQPGFSAIKRRVPGGGLPNADRVMNRALALPTHHGLTDEDIEHVEEVLSDWIKD